MQASSAGYGFPSNCASLPNPKWRAASTIPWLCYQLPGIARGGTTLVISPLIALMEDQVAKLKELGFAVERIPSGRERAEIDLT